MRLDIALVLLADVITLAAIIVIFLVLPMVGAEFIATPSQ